MRFRVDRDGFVTGLRFYKGPGNGGTHVGTLWTTGGSALATATFTAESAMGWQQVALSLAGGDHGRHDLRRLVPRSGRALLEHVTSDSTLP